MRTKSRDAFTLIELLVVLTIVGIMSAFVVPRLTGSLGNLTQKTAARKICAALRYARSQAVSEGVTLVAFIDKKEGTLVIGDKNILDNTLEMSKTTKEENIGVKNNLIYKLPGEVDFEKLADSEEDWSDNILLISFYPSGCTSGGSFRLTRPDKPSHIVRVDRITGVATIES